VLSRHDTKAAPQTVQTASPVCGTKNFSSVRLYSAPQLHCTIVAIPGICISDRRFSSPELCHNRTDPLLTRQRFQTKNHLRKLVSRELSLSKLSSGLPGCYSRAAPLPSVSHAIASEGFAFLFTKVRPRLIGSRTPVKSGILLNRGGDCRFLALNSRLLVNQSNEEVSPNADERRFD